MRAGALGPAMPAQLGCRGASPVWGVGSSHWPQEEVEEEEEKLGQAIFLQLQELLFVSEQCKAHVDLQGLVSAFLSVSSLQGASISATSSENPISW